MPHHATVVWVTDITAICPFGDGVMFETLSRGHPDRVVVMLSRAHLEALYKLAPPSYERETDPNTRL